jgi:hypothetical protein
VTAVNHNARTIAWLAERGWVADVGESYNARTRRKRDLFGCIDIVGIGPQGSIYVQVTSRGNMAARARKVRESEVWAAMSTAPGVHVLVLGWDQPGGPRTKWRACERPLTTYETIREAS